jgi:hypothetical protein
MRDELRRYKIICYSSFAVILIQLLIICASWYKSQDKGTSRHDEEWLAGSVDGQASPRDRDATSRAGTARKDSPPARLTNVSINANGDILIPKELADRILISPLKGSEFIFDEAEMKLFGFNDKEIAELQEVIDREKSLSLSEESTKFKIVSETDNQVLLAIPSDPASAEFQKNQLLNEITRISGDKSPLIANGLSGAIGRLNGSFGKNDRLIRVKNDGGSESQFEILEILPVVKKELEAANAPYEDYERSALSTSKYKSDKIPERLKHLFQPQ